MANILHMTVLLPLHTLWQRRSTNSYPEAERQRMLNHKIKMARELILFNYNGFKQLLAGIHAAKAKVKISALLYDYFHTDIQQYLTYTHNALRTDLSAEIFKEQNDTWLIKYHHTIGLKAAKAIHDQVEFTYFYLRELDEMVALSQDGDEMNKLLKGIKAIIKKVTETITTLKQSAHNDPNKQESLLPFLVNLENFQYILQGRINYLAAFKQDEKIVLKILQHLKQKFDLLDLYARPLMIVRTTFTLLPCSEKFLQQIILDAQINVLTFFTTPNGNVIPRKVLQDILKNFSLFARESELLTLEIKELVYPRSPLSENSENEMMDIPQFPKPTTASVPK